MGPTVVAVVGATATGKSDLGVALALAMGGEVINADASQLYRGMDIGTAKLTAEQRQGVPHHLLDVLDVTDEASVAAYQRDATGLIDRFRAAGRTPVVVGGSGLYLRAALDRLQIPPTDPQVRGRLEGELAEIGSARLHQRLAELDPAAAGAILPGNGRRVVRALEVIELTGGPFVASLPDPEYRCPTVQLGLRTSREVLDRRIRMRVERMWAAGLVEEVRQLVPLGLAQGRTAARAIGYAQVLELLAGRIDEAGAHEETVRATTRLVRRQESWLRRDRRIHWLDADSELPGPALLAQALDVVRLAPDGSGREPRGLG